VGYIIHLSEEEGLTLSASVVRRLIEKGSGDAALLYIYIAKCKNSAAPEKISAELRWTPERLRAAEDDLRAAGLIGDVTVAGKSAESLAPPERECPEYGRAELLRCMESDRDFDLLRREVGNKLGKLLSDSDLNILMGLYDFLGLPPDVIYLLVSHCVRTAEDAYGKGRRPTMKQIEKEGYRWARQEIFTQEAANKYLHEYSARRSRMPKLMRALNLGDRAPVQSEAKYLEQWITWGFGPEAVAMAYDRTVYHCHELKWPYLNSILKRWNDRGLHTPKEIREGDVPNKKVAAAAASPAAASAAEDRESIERMKKYLRGKRGGEAEK
jgi:hypothetical protein